FLTAFVPRLGSDVVAVGRTIHFHCTDTDGEWLVTGTAEGTTVTREHAKGDVAARGTASDLFLFLWGRVASTALDVFGDVEVLDRFRGASHV
ncbi:MAG TPA: maleylpyruvate isomerase family mycothiol-dependent enzyme, partial [Acidimicrobiia bacterium]